MRYKILRFQYEKERTEIQLQGHVPVYAPGNISSEIKEGEQIFLETQCDQGLFLGHIRLSSDRKMMCWHFYL
jgi:hypothetical protein